MNARAYARVLLSRTEFFKSLNNRQLRAAKSALFFMTISSSLCCVLKYLRYRYIDPF